MNKLLIFGLVLITLILVGCSENSLFKKPCYISIPYNSYERSCRTVSMFELTEKSCELALERCSLLYNCKIESWETFTKISINGDYVSPKACGGGSTITSDDVVIDVPEWTSSPSVTACNKYGCLSGNPEVYDLTNSTIRGEKLVVKVE